MRLSDQEYNRLRLLKAIRRAEPVARTDLTQLTGLAAGTISELTRDLVARNILIEERAPVRRGRPRVELRLNPNAAHVVAVGLGFGWSAGVEIIDMTGRCVSSYQEKLPFTRSIEDLAQAFASAVDHAIGASPFVKDDIDCIGVTLPAITDTINGIVHWMVMYPPEPTPFAAIMQGRLGIPVIVDNGGNVMARAEHWFGEGPRLDDFTLFAVSIGMATAYYAEGMLWVGAHGFNPELAHAKVVLEHGRACYCGTSGCMAAYSSGYAIVEQYREARGLAAVGVADVMDNIRAIAAEARAGDSEARTLFERAGLYLGTVLADHINAQDPARILLLYDEPIYIEMIRPAAEAALAKSVIPALRGRATIEFRPFDDEEMNRKGAAALALEQIYRAPLTADRSSRQHYGAVTTGTADYSPSA
jgi:predicted NBD/HSP70 family sugar kinase